MNELFTQFLTFLLLAMGICFVLAVIGLALIARSIRNIHVPRDADFFTTMRYIPLTLVVLLDMLDFALDIFSAPIAWIVLDRMGLPNLRNKATLEAIIPATGPLPTFTIAWFLARMFNLGELQRYATVRHSRRTLEEPHHAYPQQERRRPPARTIDMDDY